MLPSPFYLSMPISLFQNSVLFNPFDMKMSSAIELDTNFLLNIRETSRIWHGPSRMQYKCCPIRKETIE